MLKFDQEPIAEFTKRSMIISPRMAKRNHSRAQKLMQTVQMSREAGSISPEDKNRVSAADSHSKKLKPQRRGTSNIEQIVEQQRMASTRGTTPNA